MEAGNANAFRSMGVWYLKGQFDLPQDVDRGLELTKRAADLGSASAHFNIATVYSTGQHVPSNAKKAVFHYQQAAMRGHTQVRHNLGSSQMLLGNPGAAIKHWMIAAASGIKISLDSIQLMFTQGTATKAQFESALRVYQNYQEEIKM